MSILPASPVLQVLIPVTFPEKHVLSDVSDMKAGLIDRRAAQQLPLVVEEPEVIDSESDSDDDLASTAPTLVQDIPNTGVIHTSFKNSRSQWIEDPVISQWHDPNHRIHQLVTTMENLYHEWSNIRVGPFDPVTDATWLQVGHVLASVGLPWHNNGLNMPAEIDTTWPFHFKKYEAHVIKEKGSRVGDRNPSGYVCNWGEANCFGIRALQQELRETHPKARPLLVYDNLEDDMILSASRLFGLEHHRVQLALGKNIVLEGLKEKTQNGLRPIIFAASLGNHRGNHDDLTLLCTISESLPIILHIDATRNFDYVTTMDDQQRIVLDVEKITLGTRKLDLSLRSADGSVLASTIVAGGPNHTYPAQVTVLKPQALSSTYERVAYVRASDSTLAGSRDAIASLWVALQEIRFGKNGFNQIFSHCYHMRARLVQALEDRKVPFSAPRYTLDVIFENVNDHQAQELRKLGASKLDHHRIMITVQPSVQMEDIDSLLEIVSLEPHGSLEVSTSLPDTSSANAFPVPREVIEELTTTVHTWKVEARWNAGYPLNQTSYSVLGPLLGNFLDIDVPREWILEKSEEMIQSRLRSFGLVDPQAISKFKGSFTNGSTMGNRVGVHTALAHCPGAYLYFSKETHYSVRKTARDCDDLTNRWLDRPPRYSEIECEANGSICVDKLVQQALHDQEWCRQHGEVFRLVLLLNIGTTFVGARDDIQTVRQGLRDAGIEISYIHIDGALDCRLQRCGLTLGPPGLDETDGLQVVQGVTASHHKAMGNTVSGEILCYSPGSEFAVLGADVDPRAILEAWFYSQAYDDADIKSIVSYCSTNASQLEAGLSGMGITTKRNADSPIVVFDRPPAWITEEFSLRPERDWVHFITMPHISPDTVDSFLDRMAWVDRQCGRAFRCMSSLLASAAEQPLRLKRVQRLSKLADKVLERTQSLVQPTEWSYESADEAIKTYLRGAVSVVAVDSNDEPAIVFLARSTREKVIRAGPVLVKTELCRSKGMILDVARQLVGSMARHLDVRLETDATSYVFLPLQ